MKRILFILLAVMGLCGMAQAQVGIMRSGYGVSKQPKDIGPISRQGFIYYYHNDPMTYAEMLNFVNSNCERAYQYYQKQQKIQKAGWGLFGSGLAITVAGATMLGTAYKADNRNIEYQLEGAGIALVCIGPITTVLVSVPMIIAADANKRNAYKVYNTWCGYKELEQETSQRNATPLELRLQSSSNGLGLALSF